MNHYSEGRHGLTVGTTSNDVGGWRKVGVTLNIHGDGMGAPHRDKTLTLAQARWLRDALDRAIQTQEEALE